MRSAVGGGGRFGAVHSQIHGTWFQGIPGLPPSLLNRPQGCSFRARCPQAMERCATIEPVLREVEDDRRVSCHLY